MNLFKRMGGNHRRGGWARAVGRAVAGIFLVFSLDTLAAEPQLSTNWVQLKPGAFTLGSPSQDADRGSDESPPTQVTITQGFWMHRHEVTQGEYLALMRTNPAAFTGDLNRPVERVSWQEAVNYCVKLTVQEQQAGRLPRGYVYRLPTEAEWEYACRAGATTRFGYGDDPQYSALGQYAWSAANGGDKTHPVAHKKPNAWGLYDLHGNVWEWCLDWYAPSYPGGKAADPTGAKSGLKRVVRGGCWNNPAAVCRAANRNAYPPGRRSNGVGFRVVLAPNI